MTEHRDWVTAAASALYGAMLRQTERLVLRGHERPVYAAAFAPDGRTVVTAGSDRTARLWEAASGAERLVLRGHQGAVSAAAFALDGRSVVTAGSDRTARLWPVFGSLREMIGEARRRLPRQELTAEERRRYFLPEA